MDCSRALSFVPRSVKGRGITIVNHTRYSTQDLKVLLTRACAWMGCQKNKVFVLLPSTNGTTRGCAEVGPSQLVYAYSSPGRRESRKIAIEIAPPSRFTISRLAKIAEHEILHTMGVTHAKMTKAAYWSLGPLPEWARGLRVRVGR
jgi:hypothetical protein